MTELFRGKNLIYLSWLGLFQIAQSNQLITLGLKQNKRDGTILHSRTKNIPLREENKGCEAWIN